MGQEILVELDADFVGCIAIQFVHIIGSVC